VGASWPGGVIWGYPGNKADPVDGNEAKPQADLAEFTIGSGNLDFYDISNVVCPFDTTFKDFAVFPENSQQTCTHLSVKLGTNFSSDSSANLDLKLESMLLAHRTGSISLS